MCYCTLFSVDFRTHITSLDIWKQFTFIAFRITVHLSRAFTSRATNFALSVIAFTGSKSCFELSCAKLYLGQLGINTPIVDIFVRFDFRRMWWQRTNFDAWQAPVVTMAAITMDTWRDASRYLMDRCRRHCGLLHTYTRNVSRRLVLVRISCQYYNCTWVM